MFIYIHSKKGGSKRSGYGTNQHFKQVSEYITQREKTEEEEKCMETFEETDGEIDDRDMFIGFESKDQEQDYRFEYITRKEKTRLVSGLNCASDAENAYQDMMATKEMFQKTGGRQFFHFVFAIHPEDSKQTTPEAFHDISKEFIQIAKLKNYQVLMATHTDKPHLHTHYIINSVEMNTGKKLLFSMNELNYLLPKRANELCERYGFSHSMIDVNKEQYFKEKEAIKTNPEEFFKAKKAKQKAKKEQREAKKESYKTQAFRDISEVKSKATSREDFILQLQEKGYDVTWTDSRKNITYILPDGQKVRDRKFYPEDAFAKDSLLKAFEENQKQNQDMAKEEGTSEKFEKKIKAAEKAQKEVKVKVASPQTDSSESGKEQLWTKDRLKMLLQALRGGSPGTNDDDFWRKQGRFPFASESKRDRREYVVEQQKGKSLWYKEEEEQER